MISIIQIIGLMIPAGLLGISFAIYWKNRTNGKRAIFWIFILELNFVIASFFFSFEGTGSYLHHLVRFLYIGSLVAVVISFPILIFMFKGKTIVADNRRGRANR